MNAISRGLLVFGVGVAGCLTSSSAFMLMRPTDSFSRTNRGACGATREDATTDLKITIPPYLEEEDDKSYPSPLHSIYVKSIMSDEEAAKALELASSFASATGRWEQPDAERHQTYATCDFPVEDCEDLHSYLEDELAITDAIFEQLSENFGVEPSDLSYIDFFVAQYQAAGSGSGTTMDRLEAHRDGSLLSFTITLTPPESFSGGGTFFEGLKTGSGEKGDGVVRPSRAGDAVLHCGKLLHGAEVVTEGTRTVLVGFVDVGEWCTRRGSLSSACREWGRMDVAARRYQRQLEKATLLGKQSWSLNNERWLQKEDFSQNRGRSYMKGVSPAFSSVKRRANFAFQRQRRLVAEDKLLRTILLPEDKREAPIPFDVGDITIL